MWKRIENQSPQLWPFSEKRIISSTSCVCWNALKLGEGAMRMSIEWVKRGGISEIFPFLQVELRQKTWTFRQQVDPFLPTANCCAVDSNLQWSLYRHSRLFFVGVEEKMHEIIGIPETPFIIKYFLLLFIIFILSYNQQILLLRAHSRNFKNNSEYLNSKSTQFVFISKWSGNLYH